MKNMEVIIGSYEECYQISILAAQKQKSQNDDFHFLLRRAPKPLKSHFMKHGYF